MSRQAGDELAASTETIGHADPDENTDAGDVVAIGSDGNLAQADGDEGHVLLGVRARNRQTGDVGSVHHDGPVIAAVADGVSGGDGLAVGNATDGTVGEFDTDADAVDGAPIALSDEGGEYRGASVPDGHAAVLL